MKMLISLLLLTLTVSCASKDKKGIGSVALKIDDEKGIAKFPNKNIPQGEKLKLVNNECKRISGRGIKNCKLVPAGEVLIGDPLNETYAEFQTVGQISFSEGSILKVKSK